jgi:hypothetical protein
MLTSCDSTRSVLNSLRAGEEPADRLEGIIPLMVFALAFVKPTADENDWSSETHTSCIPNDVQRRVLEGI